MRHVIAGQAIVKSDEVLQMAGQPDSASEVFNVSGLVQYQDGGIVSRVILKKTTGSITLFAFDQGEELSEHTTPHDAVAYILEGRAEITVGEVVHEVAAGEALRLPANQPHAVTARERFKMMLTMLRTM